jgi:plastocyanin
VNLLIFTRERNFTKSFIYSFAFIFLLSEFALAWNIDLSRRRKDLRRQEASVKTESMAEKPMEMIGKVFPIEPKQEVVILNTEKGFVPSTLRLRQGQRYKIHVVNVNKENQNVSFIMDYYGQHHGTFYGNVKSFVLKTEKEGVFSYQCPETAFEGTMVVYSEGKSKVKPMGPAPTNLGTTTLRGLASEQ